ncbi:hypothetical protein [uncultured Robinsoniella sp.]|uniref:hypothetical protein n=1 Tax=uncultured Robinsoniella sp. TaxID=904190 RepID=UPI00374FB958
MEDLEKLLIGLLNAQNPASHSKEFKSSLWDELQERLQESMQQEELDFEELDMVAAGVRNQEILKKHCSRKEKSYE